MSDRNPRPRLDISEVQNRRYEESVTESTRERAKQLARNVATDYDLRCEQIDDPDPEWLIAEITNEVTKLLESVESSTAQACRIICDTCGQDVSDPEFAGHRTILCHKPTCLEAHDEQVAQACYQKAVQLKRYGPANNDGGGMVADKCGEYVERDDVLEALAGGREAPTQDSAMRDHLQSLCTLTEQLVTHLPDGEYKGLGEVRIMIRNTKALLSQPAGREAMERHDAEIRLGVLRAAYNLGHEWIGEEIDRIEAELSKKAGRP